MLARLLSKPSHLRLLSNLSSKYQPLPKLNPLLLNPFSTDNNNNNNNNSKPWNFSEEPDSKWDSLFSQDSSKLAAPGEDSWLDENKNNGGGMLGGTEVRGKGEESWLDENENSGGDIFGGTELKGKREESWLDENDNSDRGIFGGTEVGGNAKQEWFAAEEHKPWVLEEEETRDELFDVGDIKVNKRGDDELSETEKAKRRKEKKKLLRKEKEHLTAVLKGPKAFGDLIAASGITDEMLGSLIALRDFEEIEGLPPLTDIEDMRYEKNTRKSARAEIERQKQEEVAKARVRQVDEKGRAYGTGRRKCSIARVWIQPGDGKFLVNDKQFDAYFPMIDHRAALLQPFAETKTLGLWDINCTVKGGGVSGQVGAIQLGISRALQNWEPDMRPSLKSVGLLTRDPRVVERKKPGKAKARKSFTWVKR